MNDNIDLTKILKNCPKEQKLYSPLFGEVDFKEIRSDDECPIIITKGALLASFTEEGFYYADEDGECLLFPSKEQRDWSKFSAPWYKKEKFDPKTLQPFDKVLVRCNESSKWGCHFFSYIDDTNLHYKYRCICGSYAFCIPCNNDTQHLVGTTEEAPEYYRYWED